MVFDSRSDRARQSFASQFEDSDGRILYRRDGKGAPIEVTAAERDALVDRFVRDMKWVTAGGVVVLIIGILVPMALLFWKDAPPGPLWTTLGLAPGVAFIFLGARWAWRRPQRVLASRSPVGAALSKSEARARGVARLTWAQLGSSAVAAVALAVKMALSTRLAGPDAWWLVLPMAILALVAVQAGRKWLAERDLTLQGFVQANGSALAASALACLVGGVLLVRAVPHSEVWQALFKPQPAAAPRGPPPPSPRQPIRITVRDANPDWLIQPTMEQMEYYYPAQARRAEKQGEVVIDCQVRRDGGVRACSVLREQPIGFGFGAAAIQIMTSYAEFSPKIQNGVPVDGAEVKIPVAFRMADAASSIRSTDR